MVAKKRELALLLALSVLWGASYTFIKVGVESIPPLTLIAVRTAIAGLLLVVVIRWRGLTFPSDAATWGRFVVQACLNSAMPFTLLAWAERKVDAGLAAILNSTAPIFTFLLTVRITRHEPVTARKLFGVLVGLAGTCLIVGTRALAGVGDPSWEQLAIVAATICYAGAAVFGKGFKDLDPVVPAAGSLLAGAAMLLPLCLVLERPWVLDPSSRSLAALLALSVFSTALALVIYFRLLKTLGSVAATAQAYLRVPVGVAIGVVFLDERLTTTAGIGLVCILSGVMAMTLPSSRQANAKTAARN